MTFQGFPEAVPPATSTTSGGIMLAADLGGTGTAAATPRVASVTGLAGVVSVRSGSAVSFDGGASTASVTGLVRMPNNVSMITFRNAANSADIACFQNDNANNLLLRAGLALYLDSGSSGSIILRDSTNATGVTFALASAGSSSINFAAGVTSANIGQTISTTGNGAVMTIQAQSGKADGSNRNGGNLRIIGGSQNLNGLFGGVSLGIGVGGFSATLFEVGCVANPNRFCSINLAAPMSTAELPANTGDLITFVGNAATDPTAQPVGGGIMYATAGKFAWQGSSAVAANFSLDGTTSVVATAGALAALPNFPAAYLVFTAGGTGYKIPMYNT